MRTRLKLLREMLAAKNSPAGVSKGLSHSTGQRMVCRQAAGRLTNSHQTLPLLLQGGHVPASVGLAKHEGQKGEKAETHVAAGQQQGKGKAVNTQHLYIQDAGFCF